MALVLLRSRIAVVELYGTLGGSVKSRPYERLLSQLERDRRVRAVVLDVDSPGGAVTASDYLYRRVVALARRKSVVACIRGLGASGAYMVCCGAHRIVASPGAIVGSIGVISVRPILRELLERMGVSVAVSKSGPFKDMGAPWREVTPEEREKLQELVDRSFDTFVSIVAQARGMETERVRQLATGEVYWAPQALELGLVDELGDLERAIDLAAELSGAPRRPVFLRPRRGLRDLLVGTAAGSLVEAVSDEIERRLLGRWPLY